MLLSNEYVFGTRPGCLVGQTHCHNAWGIGQGMDAGQAGLGYRLDVCGFVNSLHGFSMT